MQANCDMQHAAMKNTVMAQVSSRVQYDLPGAAEREFQTTKEEDQFKSIIHNQTTNSDNLPPQTEIPHTVSEPNHHTNDSVTNTKSARMPHPSASVLAGDTIDCAGAFVAQKPNHPEPIMLTPMAPVLNGSHATTCENNQQAKTPTNNNVSSYHKDGHYFLALVKSEQTRLLAMAEQADHDMYTLTTNATTDISDEVFGILRSVLGKTKLLVSQKFKQFEGLCHSNLNPTSDEKFPTTVEDLQGFWDMVNLQIEHVDSLFKELDLIKANDWQTTKDTAAFVPAGSKLVKRAALKNGNTNNTAPTATVRISPNAQLLAQKREAQRKQLLELKRKHKNAAATADKGALSNPIEIFISENCV